MAKGINVKITKKFSQCSSHYKDLAVTVQSIVDEGGTIVSILTITATTVEILYVTSKREEVEVDIPDEIEALDQADGSAI